jgi:tetratricopeptide (TPR) repeat protein
VELHAALGEVLMLLGDYDGALGHLEAAEALAAPGEEAAIEHRIGLVLARRGDWARAERHLVAALDLLGPDLQPGVRSRILVDRSAIAHRAGDLARAEALADESLALAEVAADPSRWREQRTCWGSWPGAAETSLQPGDTWNGRSRASTLPVPPQRLVRRVLPVALMRLQAPKPPPTRISGSRR